MMDYLEGRERRIQVLEETIRVCERERILMHSVKHTRKYTMLYRRGALETSGEMEFVNMHIRGVEQLQGEDAATVLRRLHVDNPEQRIGLISCIDSRHLGGEAIRGGDSIESHMCRCSTLYSCLNCRELREIHYMEEHRKAVQDKTFCIYMPGIVAIREKEDELLEGGDWYLFDMIGLCSARGMKDILPSQRETSELVISGDEVWKTQVWNIVRENGLDMVVIAKDDRNLTVCRIR